MFQTNTSENTLILPDTLIDIKSLLFLLYKNAISTIFLNLLTRLFILILLILLSEDQGLRGISTILMPELGHLDSLPTQFHPTYRSIADIPNRTFLLDMTWTGKKRGFKYNPMVADLTLKTLPSQVAVEHAFNSSKGN